MRMSFACHGHKAEFTLMCELRHCLVQSSVARHSKKRILAQFDSVSLMLVGLQPVLQSKPQCKCAACQHCRLSVSGLTMQLYPLRCWCGSRHTVEAACQKSFHKRSNNATVRPSRVENLMVIPGIFGPGAPFMPKPEIRKSSHAMVQYVAHSCTLWLRVSLHWPWHMV